MKILISAVGSAGDVHPMVGIAVRLKQRGHEVAVITSPYFEPLLARAGIELVPVSTKERFERLLGDPDLWHPRRGPLFVMREGVLASLGEMLEIVEGRYVAGETVLVAHMLDFASRIAHEHLQAPLASVFLAPSTFRSCTDPPHLPPMPLSARLPCWMLRLQYWLIDLVVDSILKKGIDPLCAARGLPKVRGFMGTWWFSPELVLAMFPDWFAPKQADWPQQTVMAGFPLWDESELGPAPESAEVAEYLAAGEPPIVFTPGSAMIQGAAFFRAAIAACEALGRRGMLLTTHPEQLPDKLPPLVRHFDFVPFSQVLPGAAALVHHGGIGTLSQGMAASLPHLIMPMTHDQPDNARRIERLGVGESLPPKKFRPAAVAAALDRLLSSPQVQANCREYSQRIQGADAIGTACDQIEDLARRRGVHESRLVTRE